MRVQIPQTPIIQPDGKITLEWRIFFNELLRHTDISIATDAIDILEQSLDSTDSKVTGIEGSVSNLEQSVSSTDDTVSDLQQSVADIESSINNMDTSGKNLIDYTQLKTGWIGETDGALKPTATHHATHNYIEVTGGKSYTVSIDSSHGILYYARHAFYNANKVYIQGGNNTSTTQLETFTAPSNARYVRISFYTDVSKAEKADPKRVKLEEGSEATPWDMSWQAVQESLYSLSARIENLEP